MGRADYRRQIREDEKRIARGLNATGLDAYEVIALMRVLRDKLRVCIERRSVTSLMHFIYSNMTSGARFIADAPIACRKGCSHCCNIWVDAMPPEIFYAVKTMSPAQRRRAIESVDKACSLTVGCSFDDRGGMVTPCPLLEGDLCGIYSTRPINCRTAVSADAEICRRSYMDVSGEDIPTPMVWIALRQGYGLALEGAMINAGLAHTSHEWNEALRLALSQPDAEAHWLGGTDVFATVPRTAGGNAFDQPIWQGLYREAFGAVE
jgi:hypothetical protein